MKEKDDKILLAQVSDKIEMCENKNKIEYTNFLDLAQIELVQNYIDKLKIENYISYGGYEQSERKLFVIYPEKFNSTVVEKNLVSIVKIVRIQLPDELKGKYAHRDYLGAVIKLGVKREKVGDIIVDNDGADIIVEKDISKFLLENYRKNLCERYKLEESFVEEKLAQEQPENYNIYEIMLEIGKKRGCVMSGGKIDEEKTARILLDEFKNGQLGKITIEKPKRQ